MAADLYKDDLAVLTDAEIRLGIENFIRISEPPESRPRESFLLDFKQEWNDSALQTVAAFAHTFGGILIVGISEQDGVPESIVGVDSRGELQTSIASSIATSISPVPEFTVKDCSVASEPQKKLAVVRVRPGNLIYYYTKKDSRHPIYVRNNDESVPANAAQLRALIERRASAADSQPQITTRLTSLRNVVQLRRTAGLLQGQAPSRFQVVAIPSEHPSILIDSEVEQQFRKRIQRNFAVADADGKVEKEEDRYVDWYEWRWFNAETTNESVWRLTSAGDAAYATQVRVAGQNGELAWSLGDIVAELVLFLAVVRSMWKMFGFYGEATLLLTLAAHDLALRPDLVTNLLPLNNPKLWYLRQEFSAALKDSIMSSLTTQPTTVGAATGNRCVLVQGVPRTLCRHCVGRVDKCVCVFVIECCERCEAILHHRYLSS